MARRLLHWLKAYCAWTEETEAPKEFHFWTGVATIAAALRRRVYFDQGYYTVIPNFYVVLVARPGIATKSTVINFSRRLLTGIKGVNFGPDSMTWQGLGKVFESAGQYYGPENNRTYIMPLVCYVSELGTFLRPEDSGLLSFLTDVWDGREQYLHRTRDETNAITLTRPCINLIGATTPQWIETHFPTELLNEGLGSRIIFVYANRKNKLVAYPEAIPEEFKQREEMLKADLTEISKLSGAFTIAPDAKQWGTDWYNSLHTKSKPSILLADQYDGYFARKQSHLHKLAMILSVAERDDLIISQQNMVEADMILEGNERPMATLFNNVNVIPESKRLHVIIRFIIASGAGEPVPYTDVKNFCSGRMTREEREQAIKAGLDAKVLQTNNKGVIWTTVEPDVLQ